MESLHRLNPLTCALFIVLAMTLAGTLQTLWFRTRLSRRLAIPLDRGITFRRRRLLGDNKTVRGFVVMIPASSAFFYLSGWLLESLPSSLRQGVWDLAPAGFALLGACAGLGLMLGELPNSFIKRQLRIPPGQASNRPLIKPLFLVVDRLDSIVGTLLLVSLVVSTSWKIWLYVLLMGTGIHWFFSLMLFRSGVKGRMT